jgi:predicted heme/steroid binding protein
VADGRMQDRTVYTNYSAPTAKTRSVMTCMKLAAVKGLKLDVGGAFLCAPIGDGEEVYMSLDRELADKAVESMPELKAYQGEDGKIVVRVDRAMYGLIQSAKLWYDELTRHLLSNGFQKSKADECVLVKRMQNGKYIIVMKQNIRRLLQTKENV